MGWMTRTLTVLIPGRARALDRGSGCEIERFHHARVRNLGPIVQLANVLLDRRFSAAHAARCSRHERAADVPYRPALSGHILARLDGRLLGACELIHRDALEIALHHEHWHVDPPLDPRGSPKCIRATVAVALEAASATFHNPRTVGSTGGTMARIPLVTRDQVAEKEKPAYDAFMASRTNRPNIGPYSLLLHIPEMSQKLEALRQHIAAEAALSQK